ncbi:Uncharacterised protein [Porphyromonas cangingivalis]|nr:Uncharacterised protein [Porphyromonas cangingivalis]
MTKVVKDDQSSLTTFFGFSIPSESTYEDLTAFTMDMDR